MCARAAAAASMCVLEFARAASAGPSVCVSLSVLSSRAILITKFHHFASDNFFEVRARPLIPAAADVLWSFCSAKWYYMIPFSGQASLYASVSRGLLSFLHISVKVVSLGAFRLSRPFCQCVCARCIFQTHRESYPRLDRCARETRRPHSIETRGGNPEVDPRLV